MRGTLVRLPNPSINKATERILIPSSAFSTASDGAGGGGRGRGRGSSSFIPTPSESTLHAPGQPVDESDIPFGIGHGRGKLTPSNPNLPSFSSFMSNLSPSTGRGRISPSSPNQFQDSMPKKPIFFRKEDVPESISTAQLQDLTRRPNETSLPESISSVLSGAGRGKPAKKPVSDEKIEEENRHIRASRGKAISSPRGQPKPINEEAVKKAMGVLSRGSQGGFRGRGGVRGRGGRGGFRGRGLQRGEGRGRGRYDDAEDDKESSLFLGNNADGEKFSKRVGPENMDILVEAFEEMSGRVLPSPLDDAYLDAFDTNCAIEFEPEYLMGEFGTNPDIDEKPPIPLRDALEKMKPFLMEYEGIGSQEEWEEIMEETMEKVPLLKEIVDHYSGPDRVTAKKQQEELERVSKTIPDTCPSSVKRFTDRAVLSLQSNPGWGFDKKCQFMDKLVWEVKQQYK